MAPADGSTVSGTVALALTMPARVASANVYVDGNLYASGAPDNLWWNSTVVSDGGHVISVKSFSNQGRFLGGQAVMIEVQNGAVAPTPTSTATPTATATATVTATPIHTNNPTPTIAPTPTATLTARPTVVPTPPPSPTVAPTIPPTPTSAPTSAAVVITAPGTQVHVEGTITFSAIKSAACQWINFYIDGNYIASSPPSSILWDSTSVPDGAHTLSVKGFDSSSNLLANPSVVVMVDNGAGLASPTITPTPVPTPKPTATNASPTATPSASATPTHDPLRPTNDIPNAKMPSAAELTAFHNGVGACGGLDDCSYMNAVDGQFTGTTAEIIEQAADKWCPNCSILNPLDGLTYSFSDLLKAIAVNETGWHEWRSASLSSTDPITGSKTLTPSHGDLEHVTPTQPNGGSWGLFQIAEGQGQGWPASFPLSATSTGFNADFKTAAQMGVEQGHLDYLGDPDRSVIAIDNGHAPYVNYRDAQGVMHLASTDVNERRWGAVGNWYSGGWYDSGAIQYIEQVQQYLHNQPWTKSGF